jgi:hypothetical protein
MDIKMATHLGHLITQANEKVQGPTKHPQSQTSYILEQLAGSAMVYETVVEKRANTRTV